MDPATIKIITDLGTVGVCVFVIWMGWKREERSAAAFESLNQRNHAVHVETVKQMTELTAATAALHEEIRTRPCVEAPTYDGRDRRHKGG